ncbi:class I SAM-dependent methyltransferase [Kitasatospora sp. RB6PN24]|uniref:class I SAM-dependent methyltransferase n=1 Tax=Kitasatospora humi TaxID=2893891 RepID=UPI001E60BF62|nr:class I SAM-dependent methyltransferase [Kitasatospora humi]MCC9310604.1 class I SAM-dependent methyltransferase [Kitasatospora humi]
MVTDHSPAVPDHTAVRVALWRALHTEADPPPHVLTDEIGLRLADPPPDWRARPDMDVAGTRTYRAGIVARARFVDDLVIERARRGTAQFVVLGAGLDTFAPRHPELAARLRVFEVDRPATQEWKRRRLLDLGLGTPENLVFVPSDFESEHAWWAQLVAAGFDPGRPAVVASTGVSVYLTEAANTATIRQLAKLAPESAFAMTFQPPLELLEAAQRPGRLMVEERARAGDTPFLSFFSPDRLLELALAAGFRDARHISADVLNERYFAGRGDGLRTTNAEEFLLATT